MKKTSTYIPEGFEPVDGDIQKGSNVVVEMPTFYVSGVISKMNISKNSIHVKAGKQTFHLPLNLAIKLQTI